MSINLSIENAIKFIDSKARELGCESFDGVISKSKSSGVEVFEKKIASTEISIEQGLSIRVFKNSSPGYASTELLSEEAITQTLKDALSHCDLSDKIEIDLPFQTKTNEEKIITYNPELKDLNLEKMAKFILEIEEVAANASSDIENVPHLGMSLSDGKSWLFNSNGLLIDYNRNSFGVGVGVVAKRNDISKMGFYSRSGRDLKQLDAKKIANIAVDRSLELLDPKSIPGGVYNVLLNRRISGQIISMFSSPFYAKNVQSGQSRFENKLGKQVATEKFSLISAAHRRDLPSARLYDSEGVPTSNIEVISNGVLKTYLYNLETAKKDGVVSTGNGARSGSGSVETSFFNMVVPEGKHSDEELRSIKDKCLEIISLEGNTGCSAISGEISIGVQGFLVENGKRVHAVDGITISTNFFDLLKNISHIGNEYNDSFSSIKVPSLLVANVNVSS